MAITNHQVKFEIMTENFEFEFGTRRESIPALSEADIWDLYNRRSWVCPEKQASFDSEAEAVAAFEAQYANYGMTRAEKGMALWLIRGQMAWIEQNEYDDDGELIQGGDVIRSSVEPYQPDVEDE